MNIRSKLALALAISTVMLSNNFRLHFPILTFILSLTPILWMLLIRKWKGLIIYILFLFLSYMNYIPLLKTFYDNLPWFILLFLTIIKLVLPGMTIGFLIIQTTSISQYLNGLSRMHIPMSIALATSVFFRFMPTIQAENQGIKQAMKMRGLTGYQAFFHPIKFLNYRLVPLLLSTFRIGDELSMASLCRGLSINRKRTTYKTDDLNSFDWLIITFSVLLLILWVISLLKVQ